MDVLDTELLSIGDSVVFCVSGRTVWRYVALFRQTGDVEQPHRDHGPRRILGDLEQLTLLRIILENHGIHLYEIQTKLESLFGARVSTATICRTCNRWVAHVKSCSVLLSNARALSERVLWLIYLCTIRECLCGWTRQGVIGGTTCANMGTACVAFQSPTTACWFEGSAITRCAKYSLVEKLNSESSTTKSLCR